MTCPVPTGKSTSSNWLDRLRSSKGFPAGDDLDLDRFLSPNPNSSSSNSPPKSEPTRPPAVNRASIPRRISAVSDVLSELFFIGGSPENSGLSRKKFLRKQSNPRLWVTAESNNVGSRISNNSSVYADREKKKKMKNKALLKKNKIIKRPHLEIKKSSQSEREIWRDDGDKEEEGEKELRGYSRSEVTVIDTSFEAWKTEKLVFRKKNVWKVREKKGKAKSFGRKKRKTINVDEARDFDPVEKRAKVSSAIFPDNNKNQSAKRASFDGGQKVNTDSREEGLRAEADDRIPVTGSFDVNKKPQISSSLKKLKRVNRDETDRKNRGKLLKNFAKLRTQKQHKI